MKLLLVFGKRQQNHISVNLQPVKSLKLFFSTRVYMIIHLKSLTRKLIISFQSQLFSETMLITKNMC